MWKSAREATSGMADGASAALHSHGLPRVCDIIGDYERFVEEVDSELRARGLDALARGFEMDHLCYRCATVAEYLDVIDALVPALGIAQVEGMIGGRPIATIRLHMPLEHRGFVIRCIEVPCPKPGSPYTVGLEHAELVVGQPSDGCVSSARLLAFIDECSTCTNLTLETSALHKECNAEVSHAFTLSDGRPACIKFHNRPLYEVVDWEKKQGTVVPVPEGYFAEAMRTRKVADAHDVSSLSSRAVTV
jgi:predicted metalloenzyme YecM